MKIDDILEQIEEQEKIYEGEIAVEKLAGNVVKEASNKGTVAGLKIASMIINQNMDQKLFTVGEFRRYIDSQDSRGDISYNLSDANIIKACEPKEGEGCDGCGYYDPDNCDYCNLEEDNIMPKMLKTGCINKIPKE